MDNRWKLLFNGAVSGWRLVKFVSLSYDIYENKPSRSGTCIKTPENLAMRNVGLSTYKIQMINVSCGV